MTFQTVAIEHAPKAIGPYSQAIIANGFIFSAGQIALNPATMEIIGGGIREQTERVLQNLEAVLAGAGSSLQKVVKTTVFLVDMQDFTAMNEIYAKHFGDHKPARSTVAVSGLPRGVRVEIEVVATL